MLKLQLEEYREEIKQRITETNEKIERTNETLVQFRQEIIYKILDVEDKKNESWNTKYSLFLKENFEKIHGKVDEQYNQIETNLGQVQGQVKDNQEKI